MNHFSVTSELINYQNYSTMKRNVWRWIKDSISRQGTKEDIELDIYVYLYGKQYLRHDQEVRGVPGKKLSTFLGQCYKL